MWSQQRGDIIGYDLSEDFCASANQWSLPRQGSLRLDIKFAEPLKENVNLIIYSEFDNLKEIDSDRNVYLDYAS
ncbi:CLUMA_CG002883, isoform A [Clunio marinus]|uniref:CLUMA_CG002883, isoform A n=1 Tax=Clunio marinus TaxID=568069 RepID=A0A1J1HRE9_9DIPT|nr:CLUMA_CG002883, isoform A [Clunio marinus]